MISNVTINGASHWVNRSCVRCVTDSVSQVASAVTYYGTLKKKRPKAVAICAKKREVNLSIENMAQHGLNTLLGTVCWFK